MNNKKLNARNYRYIVKGVVRGIVSRHHSFEQAQKSLRRDTRTCFFLGCFTDAVIYDTLTNQVIG